MMFRFSRFLAVYFVVAIGVSTAAAQEAREQWYRGNLHTHSLWSDGNDFPEMICDWYVRHGYNFLGLSDHNILSNTEKWITEEQPAKRGAISAIERYQERFGAEWVEDRTQDGKQQVRLKKLDEFRHLFEEPGKFVLLQAEEISDSYKSLPIHVNGSNLAEMIRPQRGDSVQETIANNIRAVQAQSARLGRPMIAHLNHPNFGWGVTAEEMAAVKEDQFFEIFNGHPSVRQLGDELHAPLDMMWDIANTLRISEMRQPPLYGLGSDDSHNYFGDRGASPGRGWIMVRAAELTPEALIEAMYDGEFYASTGVTLESVTFDEQKQQLDIQIAGEDGVTYVTEFIGTTEDYDRTSTPVQDAEGRELTRRYSPDIGQVFSKVEGTSATYKLNGNELYVRARITSSRAPSNPSLPDQMEQAWTQPVGWVKWLRQ